MYILYIHLSCSLAVEESSPSYNLQVTCKYRFYGKCMCVCYILHLCSAIPFLPPPPSLSFSLCPSLRLPFHHSPTSSSPILHPPSLSPSSPIFHPPLSPSSPILHPPSLFLPPPPSSPLLPLPSGALLPFPMPPPPSVCVYMCDVCVFSYLCFLVLECD